MYDSAGNYPGSFIFCLRIPVKFEFAIFTLTRIIKSVVTGQAPVTLELRNTPGKNTNNPRWYTHMPADAIHAFTRNL